MFVGDISKEIKLQPKEFSNDKYDCLKVYETNIGSKAFLMRNKTGYPNRWMVICGMSNVVFLNYQEALDYCKEHKFKVMSEV